MNTAVLWTLAQEPLFSFPNSTLLDQAPNSLNDKYAPTANMTKFCSILNKKQQVSSSPNSLFPFLAIKQSHIPIRSYFKDFD
jgi:hypothetical protein